MNQQIVSAGEDVEKMNPCILLVGLKINTATVENSLEIPQKLKEATIRSSNSTSGYLSKENKTTNSKRYMHPMFIAALLVVAKI